MKKSLRLMALTIAILPLLLSACSTKNSVKKVPISNSKQPILLFNKIEAKIGESTFKELNKQLKQIKPALKMEIVNNNIQVNLSSSKKSYILLTFDKKQKLQIIEGFYLGETAELKDIVTKIIKRTRMRHSDKWPAIDLGFFSYTSKGFYRATTRFPGNKLFKFELASELWLRKEDSPLPKALAKKLTIYPHISLFSKVSLQFGLSKEVVKEKLIKSNIEHTIITNRINIKLPNYKNSFFQLDFNKYNQLVLLKLEIHAVKEAIDKIKKKLKRDNDPSFMRKQNLHFIKIPHMANVLLSLQHKLNPKNKKPAEFKIKIMINE